MHIHNWNIINNRKKKVTNSLVFLSPRNNNYMFFQMFSMQMSANMFLNLLVFQNGIRSYVLFSYLSFSTPLPTYLSFPTQRLIYCFFLNQSFHYILSLYFTRIMKVTLIWLVLYTSQTPAQACFFCKDSQVRE